MLGWLEMTDGGGLRHGWTAWKRGECLGRFLSHKWSSWECSRRLGGFGDLSVLTRMRGQVWQWLEEMGWVSLEWSSLQKWFWW